jgi:hypothetical protein
MNLFNRKHLEIAPEPKKPEVPPEPEVSILRHQSYTFAEFWFPGSPQAGSVQMEKGETVTDAFIRHAKEEGRKAREALRRQEVYHRCALAGLKKAANLRA